MNSFVLLCIATVAITTVSSWSIMEDKEILKCADNKCGPEACCLIGFSRYSIPGCYPRGDVGDWCRRPDQAVKDFPLVYPNGIAITVREGFIGFCPCKSNLFCSSKKPVCHADQDQDK